MIEVLTLPAIQSRLVFWILKIGRQIVLFCRCLTLNGQDELVYHVVRFVIYVVLDVNEVGITSLNLHQLEMICEC